MHRTLQFLCLCAALVAALAATTREDVVKAADAVAKTEAESKATALSRSDTGDGEQGSPGSDLKTDASGRIFDLGLGSVYSGYGTKLQPDAASYGTYGTVQPSYAGQGLTGYGTYGTNSYGTYGGYSGFGGYNSLGAGSGYNSLGGLQPCYSGFGSSTLGSGYGGFRPSYSPVSSTYYPTTGSSSYPGTYSSSYPGSLSNLGPDYRGYKGFRGYSSTYSPYGTRYGA